MNLIWFRNDLRLDDNPALTAALETSQVNGAPVLAVYIATPEQWQKHDQAPIQIDFMERHLRLIAKRLQQAKIPLLLKQVADFSEQLECLNQIIQQHNVTHLFFNDEVEINELKRDKAVIEQLSSSQVNVQHFEADVVMPKGSVLNKQNEMYRVFTPFKRAWLGQIVQTGFDLSDSKQALANFQQSATHSSQADAFEQLQNEPESIIFDCEKADSSEWPLITEVRDQLIPDFYERIIVRYPEDRDFPAIEGTSKLSPYLAIGALSPRRLVSQLVHTIPNILDNTSLPEFTWLNQLIWRDFYRHLLHHFPNLCMQKNFNNKYDALQWPNSESRFEAWQKGKTGYPIVDAAMRQLNETGWMHNRLRMIVASFLTKHLLIDWRWGEAYFSKKLIDSDLANNNGGWQWAAGTGCDAQPYFRIFNPITQSQKFDPKGEFIRKWIPELKKFSDKDIHFPHKIIKANKLDVYWPAIVDHKTAREQALDFYKSID